MSPSAILEQLSRAHGTNRSVTVRLIDGREVIGTPAAIQGASDEVMVHPPNDDQTEIGVPLTAITSVELT